MPITLRKHYPVDAGHPTGLLQVREGVNVLRVQTSPRLTGSLNWEVQPAAGISQVRGSFADAAFSPEATRGSRSQELQHHSPFIYLAMVSPSIDQAMVNLAVLES